MRDLYASDMPRASSQGWPQERIENELSGVYELVEQQEEEISVALALGEEELAEISEEKED